MVVHENIEEALAVDTVKASDILEKTIRKNNKKELKNHKVPQSMSRNDVYLDSVHNGVL